MKLKDNPFSTKEGFKIGDKIIDFSTPKIMGVINVTPDSFFDGGKNNSIEKTILKAHEMVLEGAEFIDVGGYSSRPGADEVSVEEEINRTVCDHCSHIHFVYHDEYKRFLENENIKENVHVVGNTIVEVCKPYIPTIKKKNDMILVDIHRPENYKYKHRMENIIKYANDCSKKYDLPVKMLKFFGTCKYLKEFNIDTENIELIDLLSYKKYLDTIYHCKFIISDSGTGQEEPALCNTPVIVPRDFTERPQSVEFNCSIMLKLDDLSNDKETHEWLSKHFNNELLIDTKWLGNGSTSELVIKHLHEFLNK